MEAIVIFALLSAANIAGGIAFSEQLPAYQDEPEGQVEIIEEVAATPTTDNSVPRSSELSQWIKTDSDV